MQKIVTLMQKTMHLWLQFIIEGLKTELRHIKLYSVPQEGTMNEFPLFFSLSELFGKGLASLSCRLGFLGLGFTWVSMGRLYDPQTGL